MHQQSDPVRATATFLATQLPLLRAHEVVSILRPVAMTVSRIENPRDGAEERNVRLLSGLTDCTDPLQLHTLMAGAFKPADFIHPFEDYYTLPGYLDAPVLAAFFDALDTRATKIREHCYTEQEPASFAAFTYLTFLLVHPLVDGNGRVARGLLDYYARNKTLNLNLAPIWHHTSFKTSQKHKAAFDAFFKEDAILPSREDLGVKDPYNGRNELKFYLREMAGILKNRCNDFKCGSNLNDKASMRLMKKLFNPSSPT